MSSKILVVDDHSETLDMVTMILSQRGYQVIGALTGGEAVSTAESENPDLILLDVMMPEMDGYDVCRQLRANPKFTTVPIIMFTAKTAVHDKLTGFEAGADDYLTKPTEPAELAQRVELLLSRGQSVDQEEDGFSVNEEEVFEGESTEQIIRPSSPLPPFQPRVPGRNERLIVVLGARGGTGSTTVAINLAASLASDGQPVTLVDMDMVQGHVAMYLNKKPNVSVNDLAKLTDQMIAENWRQKLTKQDEKWSLLLSRPNLAEQVPVLSPGQTAVLLNSMLDELGGWVVVDAGRGLTPACMPALQKASQVIVCVRPERVAILSVRPLLSSLSEILSPDTQLHLLLVAIGMENRLPKQAVEGYLQRSFMATLTIDSEEMALAVDRGRPLFHAASDSPAAKVFKNIRERVLSWG